MFAYARELIRPRQLKLTKIQEIILSNSRRTSEKYIKLVFKSGSKAHVEPLKLIFEDTSLFSKWTLALSALVYIWKWLEMPEKKHKTKSEQMDQAMKEQKQIHELGPTGKQLVSEILCSLILNEKIQKKYWSRVSKLLTELDFWNWNLPSAEEDAQRQMIFDRINDSRKAESEEKKESVSSESDRPVSRRHSAPIILSKLNQLYTIPEDLEQESGPSKSSQQDEYNVLFQGSCDNDDESIQKIFRRVSNHIIDYVESSDSDDGNRKHSNSSLSDDDEKKNPSVVECQKETRPKDDTVQQVIEVFPVFKSPEKESVIEELSKEEPSPAKEKDPAEMGASTSYPNKKEDCCPPKKNDQVEAVITKATESIGGDSATMKEDENRHHQTCSLTDSDESEKSTQGEFSKDFFTALNTLERKSKWKRKLKHMKNVMIGTLDGVESGISNMESKLQRYHQKMSSSVANAQVAKPSIVDKDVFKAALWRSVIQLSMDLEKERELHQQTKLKLKLECQ